MLSDEFISLHLLKVKGDIHKRMCRLSEIWQIKKKLITEIAKSYFADAKFCLRF